MNAELFYANDGVVDSIDLGWIHLAFDFLTGPFDRVGLSTNICKTMGMVFYPLWADRVRADKSYTWRMTVEGRNFKDK